jgi:hypothetical protein
MKNSFSIVITAMIAGILLSASFLGGELVAYSTTIDTEWRLTVTGLVDNPLNLTLTDLVAMPQTTIYAQIYCVGPPGFFVEEGNWTGVKLGFLLKETGISPNAIKVAFYASDGFSTDLALGSAENDTVIVAYEKDDKALSETLRLVVPGRWGYKWIHHLNRIELVDYNFLGKYESQGYSDSAEMLESGAPGGAGLLPGGTTLNRNGSSSISPDSPQNSSALVSPSPSAIQKSSPTPNSQPEGGFIGEEVIYTAAVATVLIVSLCLIFYFVKFRKKERPNTAAV